MNNDARRRWFVGEAALGGLLLLLGILVLLGQALDLDVGETAWPFFVILPGLGLLGLGLATPGRPGEVLATVGGVVTMAGLVLGVQNATDQFDTWAYAWTLVFLVGAGSGRWLVGTMRGRRELVASGGWLVAVGLVGFLGFAVLFEVVVGLGDHRPGAASRYVLAALLILAGLALLTRRLLAARRPWGQPRPDRGPDGRMVGERPNGDAAHRGGEHRHQADAPTAGTREPRVQVPSLPPPRKTSRNGRQSATQSLGRCRRAAEDLCRPRGSAGAAVLAGSRGPRTTAERACGSADSGAMVRPCGSGSWVR